MFVQKILIFLSKDSFSYASAKHTFSALLSFHGTLVRIHHGVSFSLLSYEWDR
jgi:hypothetical protein